MREGKWRECETGYAAHRRRGFTLHLRAICVPEIMDIHTCFAVRHRREGIAHGIARVCVNMENARKRRATLLQIPRHALP